MVNIERAAIWCPLDIANASYLDMRFRCRHRRRGGERRRGSTRLAGRFSKNRRGCARFAFIDRRVVSRASTLSPFCYERKLPSSSAGTRKRDSCGADFQGGAQESPTNVFSLSFDKKNEKIKKKRKNRKNQKILEKLVYICYHIFKNFFHFVYPSSPHKGVRGKIQIFSKNILFVK